MDLRHLTVVIPTHDTREITLRCLASLGESTARGAGVVLVDDGSGDGTADVVRTRYPAVRVIRHQTARGFTESANAGLAGAGGDLLFLLNSDTEVDQSALPRLAKAFDDDPRLGIASPLLRNPDGSPQWSGGPAPTRAWLFFLASGLPSALGRLPGYRRVRPVRSEGGGTVDWVTGAAMAIRRQTWEQVGPLDASFRFYVQDLDFCVRAGDAGWLVRLITDAHVVHLGGASIGQRAGAASGTHPELLWTDLLRWGAKRRGPAWAAQAGRFMALGARLRLLARGLAQARRGSEPRAEWSRDTEAYRLALRAVNRFGGPGPRPPTGRSR